MSRATNRPLFHLKTLQTDIQRFTFPSDLRQRHEILLQWVENLRKGVLHQVKEVSLHGDFLRDIFQDILGYRSLIQSSGEAWEIHAEPTLADGGGAADGAIGFFTATAGSRGKVKLGGRIIAPIELKGTKNDLDRPAPGRQESAVDQGWRYANYTPNCQWVIVSNYQEIRLYQTSKTPAYYESFWLEDLENWEAFKTFYFILCRQNFLAKSAELSDLSRIDRLLKASDEAEKTITDELYGQYKAVRLSLTQHFRRTAPKGLKNRDFVLIEKSQKLLDRVLFIAFCEDCGLLPSKTLTKAYEFQDLYGNSTPWDRYKKVFRWVDVGNANPAIPGYNGGLFKPDALLDEQLEVTDALCGQLNQLTRFDFATEVSVNILGRIFEQSITDLEELKSESTGQPFNEKQGKRKRQGVYYTPAFITEYMVSRALGGYLREQEQRLAMELGLGEVGAIGIRDQREVEIEFWQGYRSRLEQLRVLDPACGSGAFLIAAFDYLSREYGRVDRALGDLGVQPKEEGESDQGMASRVTQGDLWGGVLEFQGSEGDPGLTPLAPKPEVAAMILGCNLYGVDLSPESVEITKLSLWLKTAKPGQVLLDLDHNIKVGNSIIGDAKVDKGALNWRRAFPQVFEAGGFDVVLGNPPYVRQELLSPFKGYLQAHYQTYDGVADLYVYFYEKGLEVLKPGGVLSYIVTNKWFKAGYGEPLRRFFAENSVMEQILDFGHAPIFEDADVFPCIITARKPGSAGKGSKVRGGDGLQVRVCPVPREKLAGLNLAQYVQEEGYDVPWDGFSGAAWSLEPPAVHELMQKIRDRGVPLKDFVGSKPYYGIKTGLNEAFLIDDATRNRLVQADPGCAEIIKPYLRGQDIKRWSPHWNHLWMILLKSSANHQWPWSGQDTAEAEECFAQCYPSIYSHFFPFINSLKNRKDQGHYWWELRACAYYDLFNSSKIIYQEINTLPAYAFHVNSHYMNNKVFIIPTKSLYLCGCLNSPLGWWIAHQIFPKMIGATITPRHDLMINFPIMEVTGHLCYQIEEIVDTLLNIIQINQQNYSQVIDWLKIERSVHQLGQKLENFAGLDCDQFLEEVRNRQPKGASFSPKVMKQLREVYNEYAPAIQSRQTQALILENQLSDLVNQAYGLTPEDIDLLWKTAPPRMPIPRPQP